jgi:hypothetical protein
MDAVSPAIGRLCLELEGMAKWVDEFPPLPQPMRFGNQAFRHWHSKLLDEGRSIVGRVCGEALAPGSEGVAAAAEEVLPAPRVLGHAVDSSLFELSLTEEHRDALWRATLRDWSHACSLMGPVPRESSATDSWQRSEATEYLWDCFGNSTRVDYGTGHETTFVLFLLSLCRMGAVDVSSRRDLAALGLCAFPRYLRVCRSVRGAYQLEPAGSHGVWSLDDFHVLSFALGAAQMGGSGAWKAAWQFQMEGDLTGWRPGGRALAPRALIDVGPRELLRGDWMLADAIAMVCESKTGAPFEEHSPSLTKVLREASWQRVVASLLGTWAREVPGKRPVAQGLLFSSQSKGGLWPAQWEPSGEALDRRRLEDEARMMAITGGSVDPVGVATSRPVPVGVATWGTEAPTGVVPWASQAPTGVAPWASQAPTGVASWASQAPTGVAPTGAAPRGSNDPTGVSHLPGSDESH